MRITFTETVVYETEGPGKGPVFKAGDTHELRDDLAQRWLRRNVAVVAAPKPDPEIMAEAVELRRNPLDHDRDGKPGGSLKGAQSTVARGRRKKGAE